MTTAAVITPCNRREPHVAHLLSDYNVCLGVKRPAARDPRRAYRVVDDFESELCWYTGAKFAVTVDSCTNAIRLALEYWLSEPRTTTRAGTVVTLPRHTYVGVLQAVLNAGVTVQWADSDWQAQHGYYPIPPTNVLDSARAIPHGRHMNGKLVCLSFHAAKQLPLGRGGAILTDDPQAAEWLRAARMDGRPPGAPIEDTLRFGMHCPMPPDVAARGLWILSRWNDSGYEPAPLVEERYPDLSAITYSARSNPSGATPERMTVNP